MKNKFLQGTVILLLTSVLLRGLGFVYQMLVVRFAGTESVGLLNMSFPFYIMLVVLATAGMPVAIAKLTAEYVSRGREEQVSAMMRTAFFIGWCFEFALFGSGAAAGTPFVSDVGNRRTGSPLFLCLGAGHCHCAVHLGDAGLFSGDAANAVSIFGAGGGTAHSGGLRIGVYHLALSP